MTISVSWRSTRFAVFATALALSACASVPGATRPAGLNVDPLQRVTVTPNVGERDLLANLIAGELALAQTNVDAAATLYADAAQASDDPAIAEQAAHIAIVSRQWDVARRAVSRWQALHGDEAGLHQARALLALHDENIDAAYAELAWLAQRPDGDGWRSISQALLGAESKLAAAAILERLLHANSVERKQAPSTLQLGSKPDVWINVGQLALRLDRHDIAQSLADQTVARFHSPEAYAWAAQLRLGDGDKAGARKLFADALRNDKTSGGKVAGPGGSSRLRIAYASLLGDLGENTEAAQILAQGPQNEFTYGARAAYLARGEDNINKPMVDALYQEVLALPGPRPPARTQLLGQLAELLDRKSDALSWYAQVPADDDHWFAAQTRTAVLLDATGKTADSLNLLHELQARSADDAKELGEVFLLEAELLNRHKRGDEAVLVYDRGLQVLPDDTRLFYGRALLNEDLNRVDAAIRDLSRVLELKPDDADAMNALGYTLADRTDRKSEALALIEKALRLKPGEPAIIDSLGWVQYRLGNLDAAVMQLRNAYAKQPDPEIAAHLGEVLWVSGQRDEARQVWERGRKKDGDNKVLLETIKRLAS